MNSDDRIAATVRQEELIADLAASMTFAAVQVGEFLRPLVVSPTVEGRSRRWFQAQSEALHFLLHMARRAAPREPGTALRRRLDEELSRVAIQSFVEVLFPELMPHERSDLRRDFLRDAPARETRYAPCSRKVGRDETLFDTSLVFSLATQLVLKAAGHESDPAADSFDARLFASLHERLVALTVDAELDRKVLAVSEALRP